ncbi:hypothetical protein [Kitasatospora sp. CB01950]|uniref:hypothetical protein n=1 Tax=Kitasatospora sp. CB01950 TaxID=1703930 RepID=UPI000939ED89|nr:hypothetical protein [Kitasatospora sp. CB01950]OKI95098.1 hypothetical protein AMK19_33050 [Kitasatospora sp. CB01950]
MKTPADYLRQRRAAEDTDANLRLRRATEHAHRTWPGDMPCREASLNLVRAELTLEATKAVLDKAIRDMTDTRKFLEQRERDKKPVTTKMRGGLRHTEARVDWAKGEHGRAVEVERQARACLRRAEAGASNRADVRARRAARELAVDRSLGSGALLPPTIGHPRELEREHYHQNETRH